MTFQSKAEDLIRQTQRYEFSDGLRDLQLAIILATLGITSWLILDLVYVPFVAELMKTFGKQAIWFSLLLLIIPLLVAWVTIGVMNYLRRRWFWRDSGMVKPLSRLVPLWATVLGVAIYLVSVMLTLGLHFSAQADSLFALQMLVVAAGWSTGVILVGLGHTIGLSRYIWFGVIGGLASTFLFVLPLTFGQTVLVFGLSWGLMFAASGITLLRHTLLSLQRVNSGRRD
jgi:hypothetical protein